MWHFLKNFIEDSDYENEIDGDIGFSDIYRG